MAIEYIDKASLYRPSHVLILRNTAAMASYIYIACFGA